MKRVLAAGCCILAFNSLSHVKSGADMSSPADGRKVLIRAIAVIVNTEANRKMPTTKIYIPKVEVPKYKVDKPAWQKIIKIIQ